MIKNILITGCSKGIGKETSLFLGKELKQNVNLLINARNEDSLKTITEDINSYNKSNKSNKYNINCNFIPGDLTNFDTVHEISNFIDQKWNGKLDSVILNHALGTPIKRIANLTEKELKEDLFHTFDTNLFSYFSICNKTIPFLRKTSKIQKNSTSRILFISSGATLPSFTMPSWSIYTASKFGINSLCNILNLEEKQNGISTLALAPGVVNTDMQKAIREQGKNEMPKKSYGLFVHLYEKKKLEEPKKIGKIVGCLGYQFPKSWSGKFVSYDDKQVKKFMEKF